MYKATVTFKGLCKLLALSSVLLALFSLTGCSSTTRIGSNAVAEYNQNPLRVQIPDNMTQEQLQNIMNSVLKNRKWLVTESATNETVGALNHRGFNAKVTLKVDNGFINIMSDATYVKPETDDEPQPAIPMGWLKNIQSDLNIRLNVGM